MTPRLIACYFPGFAGADHARLARVLAHTAGLHCQGWDRSILELAPEKPLSVRGSSFEVANTQKLEHWCDSVAAAPDGTPMLLMDADTMIVRPLDDIWERPFDFAYTVRDRTGAVHFPLNGGVVFLRVSPGVRRWVEAWRGENRRMLVDTPHWTRWVRRYGGINQAALGKLLESGLAAELGVVVVKLPCSEWNAEDNTWDACDVTRPRIVHVKSGLRRAALLQKTLGGGVSPGRQRLARMWQGFEAEARGAREREEAGHGPA